MLIAINLILLITSILLGIISFIIGIKVILRCSGSLKTSIIFLLLALVILLSYQINLTIAITGNVTGISPVVKNISSDDFVSVGIFLAILFIFLTIFYLNKTVNSIRDSKKK